MTKEQYKQWMHSESPSRLVKFKQCFPRKNLWLQCLGPKMYFLTEFNEHGVTITSASCKSAHEEQYRTRYEECCNQVLSFMTMFTFTLKHGHSIFSKRSTGRCSNIYYIAEQFPFLYPNEVVVRRAVAVYE